jgi:hypothetical protein
VFTGRWLSPERVDTPRFQRRPIQTANLRADGSWVRVVLARLSDAAMAVGPVNQQVIAVASVVDHEARRICGQPLIVLMVLIILKLNDYILNRRHSSSQAPIQGCEILDVEVDEFVVIKGAFKM